MRLFNVVTVYSNGEYVPACREIIVLKETPTAYCVEATLASGHRSRISKMCLEMEQEVATTQLEAWNNYIRRAKQILLGMGRDMTASINNVNHAILERSFLLNMGEQDEQDVKIGGTA